LEERSVAAFCRIGRLDQGTSICIVDERGAMVRELKVESHPEDRNRSCEALLLLTP
jgi:hypothetical protein